MCVWSPSGNSQSNVVAVDCQKSYCSAILLAFRRLYLVPPSFLSLSSPGHWLFVQQLNYWRFMISFHSNQLTAIWLAETLGSRNPALPRVAKPLWLYWMRHFDSKHFIIWKLCLLFMLIFLSSCLPSLNSTLAFSTLQSKFHSHSLLWFWSLSFEVWLTTHQLGVVFFSFPDFLPVHLDIFHSSENSLPSTSVTPAFST